MLLTLLQTRDSHLKSRIITLARKQNLLEINYVTAQRWNFAAAEAFPALIEFLADPDEQVRVSATNALKAIDPEAATKAGVQ
jgi:HEAT repeat protein